MTSLLGRVLRALHIVPADRKPPPQPVRLIRGGPAAPELGMMPLDIDPDHLEPGWIQLKVDGYRAFCIDRAIVTREGAPMDCALQCLPGLIRLEDALGEPMVFDGEYAEEGGYDATARAYRRGEGSGVFWIFDAVPMREWVENRFTQSFEQRMERLVKVLDEGKSDFVGFLPAVWATPAEIRARVDELWATGYEGVVWKKPGHRYTRQKSAAWLRWKQLLTADCPVLDVLVKDDVFKALIVRGPDGPLKIATGFSAAERAMLATGATPANVVEVAYNRKAGSAVPRHARFVRFREDKEAVTNV